METSDANKDVAYGIYHDKGATITLSPPNLEGPTKSIQCSVFEVRFSILCGRTLCWRQWCIQEKISADYSDFISGFQVRLSGPPGVYEWFNIFISWGHSLVN